MDKTQKKPRINGSLMAQYNNVLVCLLGKVVNVEPSGMAIHLITSDNQRVIARMSEPLKEHLGDLVEVHGVVTRNEIVCSNYAILPQEGPQPFDMAIYDKAVQLTHKYKEYYITMN